MEKYRDYQFRNRGRGFGTVLEVTEPGGSKSYWCKQTNSQSQSQIRTPAEWEEVQPGQAYNDVANSIIRQIEAGQYRPASNDPDIFLSPLNKI